MNSPDENWAMATQECSEIVAMAAAEIERAGKLPRAEGWPAVQEALECLEGVGEVMALTNTSLAFGEGLVPSRPDVG